jgi:hypothetical protein
MVDDSELDYIRTFIGKVHTAATVMHYPEEMGRVEDISDDSGQKILVHPPELMGVDGGFITKRYEVEIIEPNEAGLTTALNNIQIGIDKLNRRQTITSYTKPSTLCNIMMSKGSMADLRNGFAYIKIYLDVEWSTS